uniref:Variant surface glycoprotein 1125.3155 n=1 Tax=Trypanosoma brucei TaxID=5691 RepID=A0A1J0R9W7_9TRYP|nr:variant surface glycoprotein 1125.3155 [Trypanosoma brucei]
MKLTDDAKIAAMFTQSAMQLTANSGCSDSPNVDLQTALNGCTFAQGTAAATFTKTPPDYTKLTTQTKIFKDNANKDTCDSTVATATETASRLQQLGRAMCDALRLKPVTTRATAENGEALKTSKLIKTVIRNCVKAFHSINDVTDTEKAQELTAFIETSYGKTSADFSNKFKTFLTDEDTPTRGTGEPEKKKITDMMAATQTAEALSQMEGIRIKRELEAEKKNIPKAIDTKKAEDCKGEKDETKCNKKDGCEFKDGECKAKVTETAGTTGNTTGSNCVAINKAPFSFKFFSSRIKSLRIICKIFFPI